MSDSIRDVEVVEPRYASLGEAWEEPLVDVRKAHKEGVKGSSGAESFFCDDRECRVEKDKLMGVAGLKTNSDRIFDILRELDKKRIGAQAQIERYQKEVEEVEKNLEALALQMGYGITCCNGTLMLTSEKILYPYPLDLVGHN